MSWYIVKPAEAVPVGEIKVVKKGNTSRHFDQRFWVFVEKELTSGSCHVQIAKEGLPSEEKAFFDVVVPVS
mgnify:CR=1